MLPKQLRLPAQEIPNLAKYGKQIFSSELFHVKFLPITEGNFWAISVGLKVSKKAVVRNRVKRLFRAAIIQNAQISSSTIKPGKYLIVARSTAITSLSSGEIGRLLSSELKFS